jgi:hypothetical protein
MGYNISSPGVRSTKVRRRYHTTKARLPLPSSISGGRPPTNTCDRSPLMNERGKSLHRIEKDKKFKVTVTRD